MVDSIESGGHRTPLEGPGDRAVAPASGAGRERTVTGSVVPLANSLVDGDDLSDIYSGLTSDCARMLDIASAGLLLADARGVLQVAAASSEATRVLELFALQRQEGPCLDCYRSGAAVNVSDLSLQSARWPAFVAAARAAGIVSVHAIPMRVQDMTLGALGLFGTTVGTLNAEDLALAHALAHVASVALVTGKANADKTVLATQLQHALDSRVAVEQAKGVLAQLGGLAMEDAFEVLRRYSRDHNQPLSEIAQAVVSRDLPATVLPDLRSLLNAVEAASPLDAVEVLARELATMVAADDVTFLIADLSGEVLIRFVSGTSTQGNAADESERDELVVVALAGPYEKALRSQQVCAEHRESSTRLYAPVTDRGDAIGVLELSLPSRPDEATIASVAAAAHALAYVIIANRRHTDIFERGQRHVPFSLAAEIQRRLLPDAFTCEAAEFTVSGWLEPASQVAGDTFDYCVEREILHISMSDAMGHAVAAAQLATLAVGSLRNSRRSRVGVADQALRANAAVFDHGGEEGFVSAVLCQLNLRTGLLTVVNAGHPAPRLVRDGVATEVELEADLPFGILAEATYREQMIQLRAGDRLVLLTDGVLERNASTLDVSTALGESAGSHPREVVHSLARAVLEATGGDLQDDATVLCVDWYGRPASDGGERVASAGASQSRASQPAGPGNPRDGRQRVS
ncbi:SpoIIE family protein phosphatase [Sporichthya sp.]|uniref:SpoIIE family protein phosphatase n=1 Tax=Sporichthya sp. TaxID=65475 RepID=UPI00179C1E01|nr:SpoIIE family protein phosphatase [Sporichthya sp.]MBA3744007.1 SpoIIE family protein phosphatase [Sporichthya sp.]